ncbi:MAG: adenylyl-sulfate kinase [Verrucomicrobiota bacterium]
MAALFMATPENIHTEFHRMLGRDAKEAQLKQRGHVFWFYGLSGSGKSTLANALERKLSEKGFVTKILDGDNIRSRLNADLGFSDEDRQENIRRIAEVAHLFLDSGIVVITSFITPKRELREKAREIVGVDDCTPVYIEASFETCAARDVKGLYAKAASGGVKNFTGKDSSFEEPEATASDWTIATDNETEEESINKLLERVLPIIQTSNF